MIHCIKFLLLGLLLILVLISDIRTRKIKNLIVFPFMLIGLLISLCDSGMPGIIKASWGIVFPVLILFPLFLLKMLGAGDIKCFCAIGAIMGDSFVTNSIIYSFVTGGVLALIIMIVNKNAVKRFRHLIVYLKTCFLTFSFSQYDNFNTSNGVFRFSYAIILGVSLQFIK